MTTQQNSSLAIMRQMKQLGEVNALPQGDLVEQAHYGECTVEGMHLQYNLQYM